MRRNKNKTVTFKKLNRLIIQTNTQVLKFKTMKTTILIITTLFTISFNSAFAIGTENPAGFIFSSELSPSVPAEATFEENVPDQANIKAFMLNVLAPVTPAEADFYDEEGTVNDISGDLLPDLPAEAGFNDTI